MDRRNDLNRDLIENFRTLQLYYIGENDKGRSIAYGKAVTALRTVDRRITNVDHVKNIRGVGEKITAKIKEYLDTGRIRAVGEKRKDMAQSKKRTVSNTIVQTLQTIWGVGPKKAQSLVDDGICSISDLRQNQHLLTTQQKIGLKYQSQLLQRIPRQQITAMYIVLRLLLDRKFGRENYDLKIAGSYRRGVDTSGDMDILLTSNKFDLEDVVRLLKDEKIVKETLALKKEKFMGIASCKSNNGTIDAFRMDIEFVYAENWGSALLYFTGSKSFNMHMRAEAKRQGLLLNEHGLFSLRTGDKVLKSPTEKDIFERLGMKYVRPDRR